MGFEKYYGFLGGETDQWAPLLVQDNHFIDTPDAARLPPDRRPGGSHDRLRSATSSRRTPGGRSSRTSRSAHATLPLHAPKEFIAKYKGKFDQGWDKVREETFERQKKLGIIPKDAVLPPANPGIQAWADLNDNQKQVYCRLQEVFAGFLDHADHHLGRLFAALDDMGIRDNTLIMVVSDNGASQEGSAERHPEHRPLPELLPGHGRGDARKNSTRPAGPSTDPHYPMGWAMAGNAPLKRWKQDTHAGGNTDPFIVSWPAKIKDVGAIRTQYHHIVDVVPTLLEVSGLPAPTSVNGVAQMPLHGVSMAYTFTDGEREDPQEGAVLRDARQPGHLGRRLEGRDLAQEGHAVG